jgi:transcription initiation factor TFIIB
VTHGSSPSSEPGPSEAGSSEGCPSCGSLHLTRDDVRGEVLCADCGLVLDESALVSDRGPPPSKEGTGREARGYGPAISPLFADRGLSSEIASPHRDFAGTNLPRETALRFYRLRKLNHRVPAGGSRNRNLGVALVELNRLTSVLGLSREVRESAIVIYRRALEKRATRGKKIVALVAASVYAACRQCRVPRTMKEIIVSARATKIEVSRSYTLLARELRLGLPPVEPRDFLVRFTQELNLSRAVRQRVLELLARVEKEYPTSGILPHGVLATLIYIAGNELGERRSQDRIAAVANVTPVTIRNHHKEFLDLLGLSKGLNGGSAPAGAPPVGAGSRGASSFGVAH